MKKAKRVYVVEDMAMSRAALISILETNNFDVLGSAASADAAWMELKGLEIDFIIIDVNLSGKHNGIWLAHKIREKYQLAIIFITAFGDSKSMKKINETEPDGYLMKPYNEPSLLSVIDIALRYFSFKNEQNTRVEESSNDHIFIKQEGVQEKLVIQDILFICSEKNYISITLDKDKTFKIRNTLKAFLSELESEGFVQVHRSFVVNLNHVQSISINSLIVGNVNVPVSDSYKSALKGRINLV